MSMTTSSAQYHRDYYQKRRTEIIEFLGGRCKICGATSALEIDHIDRLQKVFSINRNMTLTNPDVLRELQKCQLLCNQCHREKTASENTGFTHGTVYGWMKAKCGCAVCLAAKKEHYEKRNARRQEQSGVLARRGSYSHNPEHGTNARYVRGCRCIACRKARAAYAREYRKYAHVDQ